MSTLQHIDGFRLSPQQLRIWRLGAAGLSTRGVALIEGGCDGERLRAALETVVARHEILRTVFVALPGMEAPVQRVLDEPRFGFCVEHRQDRPVEVALAELASELSAERTNDLSAERTGAADLSAERTGSAPLDLGVGPVLRCRLVHLAGGSLALVASLPSLCADAATLERLLVEVAAICGGAALVEEGELLQYADFAEWQVSASAEEEADFWKRLELPAAAHRLRTDGGAGEAAAQSGQPSRHAIELPAALVAQVEGFLAAHQLDAETFWFTAWMAFCRRNVEQEVVTVLKRCSSRAAEPLDTALGPIDRHVPVFFRLDLRAGLAAAAADLAPWLAELESHQPCFSWELVVSQSGGQPGGQSGDAGAPRPLGFAMVSTASHQAGGLKMAWQQLRAVAEPFALELTVGSRPASADQAARLELCVHTSGAATAAALLDGLLAMVGEALADPARPLRQLATVGDAERRLLLDEWNRTARPPSPSWLCQRLAATAAADPERPALIFGERRVSYGELDRRARQLAAELRRRGARPEDSSAADGNADRAADAAGVAAIVPLVAERSLEAVIGLFGALAAGVAYAPIDPHQPEPRLRQMLATLGGGPVLTLTRWRELLLRVGVAAERLLLLDEPLAESSPLWPLTAPSPHAAAYVITTSGSTGAPKGVVVPHGGLENLAMALQERVYFGLDAALADASSSSSSSPSSSSSLPAPLRVSLDAPLWFDASIKQLVVLGAGHTLHLVPEESRGDGEALLALCAAARLDVLDVTPAQLELMLRAGLERRPESLPRRVLTGGEALSAPTWQRLRALGGERFVNVYGPTECADVSTLAAAAAAERPVIGRPLPNVRAYVLDGAGLLVPVGAAGELLIGGAGVARGYLGSPALTAARFLPDPFGGEPGARLYRTGDRVRWTPAGQLEFLGRVDHQVKVRGFRVELGEIESALVAHPAVAEAVVLLRRDGSGAAEAPASGADADLDVDAGEARLVGYVTAARRADASAAAAALLAELHGHLRAHLPAYMIPAAFVVLERWPLNRNGKIDRAALPPPPPATAQQRPMPMVTPIEGIVWGVWAELVDPSRLGLDEDFFSLGGHSLLATQLVARLRDALQVELPLRLVFEAPTIRGLAAAIERERGKAHGGVRAEPPRLVPVPRGPLPAKLPLSFAQRRLWLTYQLDPQDTSYNAPAAFQLDGELRPELLERALTLLIERHEPLRTTFVVEDGQPVQVIHPAAPLQLTVVELTVADPAAAGATDETAANAELERRLAEHEQRPFSLERGPLFRLELVRLGERRHVVIFDMHHIVRDAWSTAILVRELVEQYAALAAGRAARLPALPLQYADFAHWESRWMTGDVYREHLAYWKRRLAGELPVLELPLDRPRRQRTGSTGRRDTFSLDAELAAALRGLGQRAGATPFMTLLAGFLVLLHRHRDQQELLIGMAIAGRDRRETEHMFGCLVNMLVLRFELSETRTFEALLRQVREVTLDAYEHQAMPFDHLVRELAPPRLPGISPFFQVAFGMQNAPSGELRLPGLDISPLVSQREQVRYDLTVWASEVEGGGLAVDWTYSDELFDPSTIARLASRYETLLRGIAADPGGALHAYELQSAAEQRAAAEQQAQKQQSLSNRLSASRRKAQP